MGNRGVVSAGHEATATAAADILRAGGNAFDAAIGAFYMACVAEPVLASLGGGGFLLAKPAEGVPRLFDFFVQTPKRQSGNGNLDFLPIQVDFGSATQEFHIGLGSIATPGCVRGMFEVHRQLGSMPMREIVAQAIQVARDGLALSALQAYIFSLVKPIFTATESVRRIYRRPEREYKFVETGDALCNPALADTMETLAIEGEDLFYRGEIARLVVDECFRGGGYLSLADLNDYEVMIREPLIVDYRGARVLTNPPPSAGGVLMGFGMRLLESDDLGSLGFGSAEYLDLLVRVMRHTNEARSEATTQTGTACVDHEKLFDGEYLAEFRHQLRQHAMCRRGTTHVNVMDSLGNVVSMTVSNGEGCGSILPGTGIMLNNMLGEEDLNPHGFHRWHGDQRMSSMMAPSVLLFPDGREVATGSGGSNRIRTALLQVFLNLIDFGMDIEQAIASPRVHYEQDVLSVEGGFPSAEVERLLQRYPDHRLWDDVNFYFGGAHTISRNGVAFEGAGDRRRAGVCMFV